MDTYFSPSNFGLRNMDHTLNLLVQYFHFSNKFIFLYIQIKIHLVHLNYQPLVLIIVIEPLPRVWILVKATTVFPEMPRPSGDTQGRQANSPTGCFTGRVGGIKILSFMSFMVKSPSTPPGFISANGYTIFGTISRFFFILFASDPKFK